MTIYDTLRGIYCCIDLYECCLENHFEVLLGCNFRRDYSSGIVDFNGE